jgi:hypothetical protein
MRLGGTEAATRRKGKWNVFVAILMKLARIVLSWVRGGRLE